MNIITMPNNVMGDNRVILDQRPEVVVLQSSKEFSKHQVNINVKKILMLQNKLTTTTV